MARLPDSFMVPAGSVVGSSAPVSMANLEPFLPVGAVPVKGSDAASPGAPVGGIPAGKPPASGPVQSCNRWNRHQVTQLNCVALANQPPALASDLMITVAEGQIGPVASIFSFRNRRIILDTWSSFTYFSDLLALVLLAWEQNNRKPGNKIVDWFTQNQWEYSPEVMEVIAAAMDHTLMRYVGTGGLNDHLVGRFGDPDGDHERVWREFRDRAMNMPQDRRHLISIYPTLHLPRPVSLDVRTLPEEEYLSLVALSKRKGGPVQLGWWATLEPNGEVWTGYLVPYDPEFPVMSERLRMEAIYSFLKHQPQTWMWERAFMRALSIEFLSHVSGNLTSHWTAAFNADFGSLFKAMASAAVAGPGGLISGGLQFVASLILSGVGYSQSQQASRTRKDIVSNKVAAIFAAAGVNWKDLLLYRVLTPLEFGGQRPAWTENAHDLYYGRSKYPSAPTFYLRTDWDQPKSYYKPTLFQGESLLVHRMHRDFSKLEPRTEDLPDLREKAWTRHRLEPKQIGQIYFGSLDRAKL
jgi:hypothetical protein